MNAEYNFGRPQDKDLERQFMERIRGDKLQAINAECDLEIGLALSGKQRNEDQKRKIQLTEVIMLKIENLSESQKQWLFQEFLRLKESWNFEQIDDWMQLPEYFFDDGCDLSYLIYNLQENPRIKAISQQNQKAYFFPAEELIFLELLCLSERKFLNGKNWKYYKTNMNFLISAMQVGLQKIQNRLNSSESNMKKALKDTPQKTKNIKKSRKKKKVDHTHSESEKEQMNESEYPKDRQLAIRTCNYISWAYWYVINKK